MSLSRTWYTDTDIALPSNSSNLEAYKSTIWAIKALLTGQLTGSHGANGAAPSSSYWTCVSSSDGVSASNSDLWGTTYDSTKLVRNTEGNAHSWILLRSPSDFSREGVKYLELSFDRTDGDSKCNIYLMNSAPASGTVNNNPVIADKYSLPVTKNDLSYDWAGWGDMPNLEGRTDHAISICRTSAGNFYIVGTKYSGLTSFIFGVVSLDDTLTASQDSNTCFALMNTAAQWSPSDLRVRGWTRSGSAKIDTKVCMLHGGNQNDRLQTWAWPSSVNPVTLSFYTSPLNIISDGPRGRFPDAYVVGAGATFGSNVYDSSGNITHTTLKTYDSYGSIVLPLNRAPANLF